MQRSPLLSISDIPISGELPPVFSNGPGSFSLGFLPVISQFSSSILSAMRDRSSRRAPVEGNDQVPLYTYSNKWRRQPPFSRSIQHFAEKLRFPYQDGVHIYPDDFKGEGDPRDIFVADSSKWGWFSLNPPFSKDFLQKHVEFWVALAKRNSCAFYIILPFRPREGWFQQLWHSKNHSFLLFLNPVAFQRIRVRYEVPGVCPKRIALFLCGISGPNLGVRNAIDGSFRVSPASLRVFSLSFAPRLLDVARYGPSQVTDDWPPLVSNSIQSAQLAEETRLKQSLQGVPLVDRVCVNPSPCNPPFDPLSPLFVFRFPREYERVYPRYFAAQPELLSRKEMNSFIQNFREPERKSLSSHCSVCKSVIHDHLTCPFRVKSITELGLFHRADLALYRFLKEFHSSQPPCPSMGSGNQGLKVFNDYIQEKSKLFKSELGQFLSPLKIPYEEVFHETYAFSRWRFALPTFWAHNSPKWVLFAVAFGYSFSFQQEPPQVCIPSGTLSPEAESQLLDRVRDLRMHPVPPDFLKVSCPVFELVSAEKVRLIHDARFIDLFLKSIKFHLPRPEDPLRFVGAADYLMVWDFSKFWSQIPVNWQTRRYFGTTVTVGGQERHFTWTGVSFGNTLGPFLATRILEKVFSNLANFFPNVRYLDDVGFGGDPHDATQEDLIRTRNELQRFALALEAISNEKTFFEGTRRIRFLGRFLHSIELESFPIFVKFKRLTTSLSKILAKEEVPLRDLASCFGKYLSLVGNGALVHSSDVFQVFSGALAPFSNNPSQGWSGSVKLSLFAVSVFSEWVLAATRFFYPSRVSSTPSKVLALFVDTSVLATGIFLVSYDLNRSLSSQPLLVASSVPLPPPNWLCILRLPLPSPLLPLSGSYGVFFRVF